MKKYLSVVICVLSAFALCAETHHEQYIRKYAETAVSEMYRSGVPASITLAQGLLESGCGRSELAVKSNNHFGIKCHNGWEGRRVYHDDDAKGECFRKYDRPEDSFRDHSDFLRYRERYAFLFDYKVSDYKSWAYGLKKAGYATDPAYPSKLIKLIEDYRLYEYDSASSASDNSVGTEKMKIPAPPSQLGQIRTVTGKKRGEFRFAISREMFSQNGVPFVYSMEGETYRSIAEANGLFFRELLSFNDLKEDAELLPGTVVYLQKKKKKAVKGLDMHVVEGGETLREIAQRYAVRLKELYRINGIGEGDAIREGDMIRLRK